MSWEWSHSQEAYVAARENLEKQNHRWLVECWTEWSASSQDGFYFTIDSNLFDQQLEDNKKLSDDILVEKIWEKMQENAVCDNGGFNAWACPYGCHTVPFT